MYRNGIKICRDTPREVPASLAALADQAFDNRAGGLEIPVRIPIGWSMKAGDAALVVCNWVR